MFFDSCLSQFCLLVFSDFILFLELFGLFVYVTMIFIIFLRGDAWCYKTSLKPLLFIGMPVESQKRLAVMYLCVSRHVFVCQPSCICVLGVSILPLSTIFLRIRKWSNSVIFIVFHLLHMYCMYITIDHRSVPKSGDIFESRKDKDMKISTVKSSDKCESVKCVWQVSHHPTH